MTATRREDDDDDDDDALLCSTTADTACGAPAGSSPSLLCPTFRAMADGRTYRQLLGTALLVRLAVLFAMALSCHFIPDFASDGETLATFPLRLDHDDSKKEPFATRGSFCDCRFSCTSTTRVQRMDYSSSDATTTTTTSIAKSAESELRSKSFWSFWLTPLTRWDAARFLQVAHRPTIRYPQLEQQQWLVETENSQTSNDASTTTTTTSTSRTCTMVDPSAVRRASEEAHPFLPLFPTLIQVTAILLMWGCPDHLLPPTCEGVLTLAAFVLNTVCFLWAALELYMMTELIVKDSMARGVLVSDDSDDTSGQSRMMAKQVDATIQCQAQRVMLIFILNPANVFFESAYSESLGVALVFTGCRCMIQQRVAKNSNAATSRLFVYLSTVSMWWMGCWVRSNGIVYAGYLLLHGMGEALQPNQTLVRRFQIIFSSLIIGMLMFFGGIGWHNYKAYQNHCVESMLQQHGGENIDGVCPDAGYQRPDWCDHGAAFNLYSHVQRKYWNVGLFRYYELKQIPNFLIAAPVLILSITAVVQWIRHSWTLCRALRSKKNSNSIIPTILSDLVEWAVISLRLWARDTTKNKVSFSLQYYDSWSQSPILLGHFAVLAASTLLCLVVAHVQIATRLICSSCPALYWFLACKISRGGRMGDAILVWCLVYILLGVILHPNWLPWT